MIATSSEGASQFRLWKLNVNNQELSAYLKIETTFTNGIKYLLETHETQLAAANEHTIKFYDFIDKTDKDAQEKIKKEKEELQSQMKAIFLDLDKENALKLKKQDIRKYFNHLAVKINSDEFKAVNKVDDECFNDVWLEFDTNETGFMSWHLIKPMISRLLEHMEKLTEERSIAAAERQVRLDEYNKKVAERKARKEELERLAMEEDEDQE